MTFADLFKTLDDDGVLPRAKDCKSALRLLAGALGFATWDECQVEAACRDEALWGKALDTYFDQLQTHGRLISAEYRRNIKSNLRTVFRVAEAHGLLQEKLPLRLAALPPRRDFDRQQQRTSPYRSTYRYVNDPYGLPKAKWPVDIQARWDAYEAASVLREVTLQKYVELLGNYFGYLTHVAKVEPQWDDLFNRGRIGAFVRWHGKRHDRTLTAHAHQLVCKLAAMAKRLKRLEEARELAEYRQELGRPKPVRNERAHAWVSLERLEEVAQACLREGRLPIATYAERSRTPGLRRILAFQRGVILAFFRRLPLRQRNVRELQLGHHLFRDHEGHWQLRFVGDDLKIRTRKGVDNEYLVDLTTFAPSWIPILEEWINNYRPRLPEPKDPKDAQLLFRTKSGGRFTTLTLRLELASIVARYTNGVRWHPHVIRRVWATEFLAETGDVVTCAVVLGDTEQTVLREYNDVLKREHHVKAAKFNGEPSLAAAD